LTGSLLSERHEELSLPKRGRPLEWGEDVRLDSSMLRYLVDEKYAARIDKSINDLRLSPAEFDEAAKRLRNPARKDVPDEDDLF
jgi:hypothetical protein